MSKIDFRDLPCWCDARCMGDCACIFHGAAAYGHESTYDCGSPADVLRVATELVANGDADGNPEEATLAALDLLDRRTVPCGCDHFRHAGWCDCPEGEWKQ